MVPECFGDLRTFFQSHDNPKLVRHLESVFYSMRIAPLPEFSFVMDHSCPLVKEHFLKRKISAELYLVPVFPHKCEIPCPAQVFPHAVNQTAVLIQLCIIVPEPAAGFNRTPVKADRILEIVFNEETRFIHESGSQKPDCRPEMIYHTLHAVFPNTGIHAGVV